jgi:uncharacterized Zn finger protein
VSRRIEVRNRQEEVEGTMAFWRREFWRPYVPVAQRRAEAARLAAKMAKQGHSLEPVEIEGRAIACTFWGKAWCENLERYSDFENRLPRGRTYVRNGSVIDLQLFRGRVEALVSGSSIYKVKIELKTVAKGRWKSIQEACAGRVDSVIELLEGRFSNGVMQVLTARDSGLFPSPKEISMDCSCPDWADMCKHVAAVLYGVGARLDARPELLFLLRGVDHLALVSEATGAAARMGAAGEGAEELGAGELERLFGIEIAPRLEEPAPARRAGRRSARASRPQGAQKSRAASLPKRVPALEEPVQGRLRLLRKHLRGGSPLTNEAYRMLFAVAAPVATRELRLLTAAGYLRRRGAKRGTSYTAGSRLR